MLKQFLTVHWRSLHNLLNKFIMPLIARSDSKFITISLSFNVGYMFIFKHLKLPTNFTTEILRRVSNRDSRNRNKFCNDHFIQ